MKSKRRLLLILLALPVLVLVSPPGIAFPANIGGDSPRRTPVLERHIIPAGAHVLVYGKDRLGKRFSYSYRQGAAAPPSVVPSLAASCSVYISDLGLSSHFYWETAQFCSGAFGTQQIHTQIFRSSWSGPRGYGAWAYTPTTSSSTLDYNWTIGCHSGGGYYNYYAVMYGYASGIGSSPATRSNNTLNSRNCGTGP